MAAPMIAWEVAGLREGKPLIAAICALLADLIHCDEVGWSGIDEQQGRVAIHTGDAPESYNPNVRRLIMDIADYPMKRHLLEPGRPTAPVRLGDLIGDRELRRTRAWADLLRPYGVRHQLTIPTAFNGPRTAASTWTFNRSGDEFSGADYARAVALQPVLQALEASALWSPDPLDAARFGSGLWVRRPEQDPPAANASRDRIGTLTPREREVLTLLARGLTATAVGHQLRITPATVRKHLEHIYAKIGKHDRLLAVQRARQTGLLSTD